ncbi:MAG: S-layer homology domain-containing protein [Acutalibacter sp.]
MTFALSAQTKKTVSLDSTNVFAEKAVNTVKLESDSGNIVTYKLVFTKASANTGKSISDFILTEADNVNLVDYFTTYNVTASGDKLKVTLPQSLIDSPSGNMNAVFTLSEGAKLYSVATSKGNVTAIAPTVDDETGDISNATINMSDFVGSDKLQYMIADEYLACEIGSTTISLETIEKTVKYAGHYTVYTVEATGTNRTGSTLNTISANDGLVTSTKKDTIITLNVPASYVADDAAKATDFFLDYTVSAGAKLQARHSTTTDVDLISGGVKKWDDVNKKVDADDPSASNPNFKVIENGGSYELRIYNGTDYNTVVEKLVVEAENGSETPYNYVIKVNAAETGAELTSVKVGNYTGTISGKTVTVALPFGTNLGSQTLTLTASKLAEVKVGSTPYTEPMTVSLTKDLTITVKSEDEKTTNVYTLKATVAEQFSDVQPGSWYYDNVMAAVDAGIVSGLGNGTFNPTGNVTRRDFAIMVVKLLLNGEEPEEADTTPFSDVTSSDYAVDYIAYCAENGIISGSDGMFRPGDYITRQEAASIMKNALELTGTTSELFNDDAKIANWAKANVYACKAAGVFNGDTKGNFNPTSTLTRAEAASIMVNALNK